MKIKFDSALNFQIDAINSITEVFKGQEICESNFTVYSPEFLEKHHTIQFNELGYGNRFTITEGKILENVQNIQIANGLKPSTRDEIDRSQLDFTVEMETGTGKTYCYLRTIMELYKRYGFSKHIIVVPSIPIKEGVFKSMEITKEHLKQLYDNVNYNYFVYDSSKLNKVRDFATTDNLEIMVINIDAFRKSFENPEDDQKKANIIHRYNDALGYKPLDLIKNTNPIVIIDEPQTTMSTDLAKKAVKSLNPMAIIRYSATHKEKINQMYKLDAVDAYEKKLVKQIEVASVITQGVHNQAFIRLLKVNVGRGFPTVKLELDVMENGRIKRKTINNIRANTDLEQLTNRIEYAGYIIKDIYAVEGNEYIDFTSRDEYIRLGEAIGDVDDKQVKRQLIRKTIEEHLYKEVILNPQGIKVLSLFFIDSVKNYRVYDEDGNTTNGIYAQIFEEEYLKLIKKPKYISLFGEMKDYEPNASEVHNGYFAVDKKGKLKDSREGRPNADDEDTYHLIMRDKERLLSFESKLRFIFSHSALKEGWDNPNVFQICTLKDAGKSDIRRRQEIGRGLRLCVNQDGERVHGFDVNTLTVMASESYVDFVENLQKEIETETGIKFGILEDHSFNNVVITMDEDKPQFLGQDKSQQLFDFLVLKGYIDERGKVQDSLRIDLKEDKVDLPEEFTEDEHIKKQILKTIKTAAGKLEVKNRDDKKKVKVNKRILDSPEFKALWDKVKFKTTFSVNFDSESLIKKCIYALDNELKIVRGKLYYSKATISMNLGGLDYKETDKSPSTLNDVVDALPDIVSYLQNETQLTRKSIVEILNGTNKLDYFKINPQSFIEGCIDIINEQMRLHVIDGIKYRKIGETEFYSQELFENEELFGYMKNNLKESSKSPFDYVVYDSNVESKLAEEFEKSSNISVYAKLPAWFKIETPLGTYNPDWAVLWNNEDEEKLFFVVETKGSISEIEMRPKEKGKIDCGKKHFRELDSDMLVANDISEVENYALKRN